MSRSSPPGSTGSISPGLLGIREFGDTLLATRDLDPLYVGLVGANLPEPQLCRYLLAYWCFYHVGVASWVSQWEGENYWKFMKIAATNDRFKGRPCDMPSIPQFDAWPRAAERRHFRGDKCVRAVEWLSKSVPEPESPVRFLAAAETEKQVMSIVQGWPMFGPWIAFKAADMMERVYGSSVRFAADTVLMYEEPKKALDLLRDHYGDEPAEGWYKYLLGYFSGNYAPPRRGDGPDRVCGPQEVETVLCKWKSYRGGHYHIGEDIRAQRAALVGWGETADRIRAAYPAEVA